MRKATKIGLSITSALVAGGLGWLVGTYSHKLDQLSTQLTSIEGRLDNLVIEVPTKEEVKEEPKQEASPPAEEPKEAAVIEETPVQVAVETQPVSTSTITYPETGSCSSWMTQAGILDQASAYTLIMRESGCNPNAVNPYTGACGIGQQLPCGKWEHTWNDPVGGMIDMQNYVLSRYGSWANALSFSNQKGWY